jgi:peptidoglycan hydrolase-like protein with peptidoglycan-binding domain
MNNLVQVQKVGFVYTIEHIRDGVCISEERKKNIIPTEGLNYLLESSLVGGARYSAWYIGLYEGDFTPAPSNTMATLPSAAVETTAYTLTTRPVWVPDAISNGAILNTVSNAEFVMNHPVGSTKTVYGGFMATSPTKAGTTGPLLSVVRFGSPKQLENGDILRVTAGLSLLSA